VRVLLRNWPILGIVCQPGDVVPAADLNHALRLRDAGAAELVLPQSKL
jgi:hypothetical protein